MEFFGRVNVYSSVGRWLAKIPAARVPRLLKQSAVVDEMRHGKVFAIKLRGGPIPLKPPTPLTPASYAGQRYVYREQVGAGEQAAGKVYALKKLDEHDAELFGKQALADVYKRLPTNGGKFIARERGVFQK